MSNVERTLRQRADQANRDLERYQTLKAAVKWLDDHRTAADIKPTFHGHCASGCHGFREVLNLLGEEASAGMAELLEALHKRSKDEMVQLERQYG